MGRERGRGETERERGGKERVGGVEGGRGREGRRGRGGGEREREGGMEGRVGKVGGRRGMEGGRKPEGRVEGRGGGETESSVASSYKGRGPSVRGLPMS